MSCRLSHFLESNIGLDRELFDDGIQDVIDIELAAVVTIHSTSSTLLLFKCLLDPIYFVELVKLCYNLAKDRFAIADE